MILTLLWLVLCGAELLSRKLAAGNDGREYNAMGWGQESTRHAYPERPPDQTSMTARSMVSPLDTFIRSRLKRTPQAATMKQTMREIVSCRLSLATNEQNFKSFTFR